MVSIDLGILFVRKTVEKMNKTMLHQIIYDSTLQYRACIEQFMDKCDECLVYLKNCIQAGKCTEEQKYVIKGLDSWMDIKGYQNDSRYCSENEYG